MKLSRLILVLLCALPMLSCGGPDCDKCDSDDDCSQGTLCVRFDDGSMRCGSGEGTTQCRTLN